MTNPSPDHLADELADTLLRLWNSIEENDDAAENEFDHQVARNFDLILAALRHQSEKCETARD
jgi:hypothetical protein